MDQLVTDIDLSDTSVQGHLPSRSLIPKAMLFRDSVPVIFDVNSSDMEPGFPLGSSVVVDIATGAFEDDGVYVVHIGSILALRHCRLLLGSNPPTVEIFTEDRSKSLQTLLLDDVKVYGMVLSM